MRQSWKPSLSIAFSTVTREILCGGSLPGATLESVGLVVIGPGPDALASRLRTGEPAVVGRVESGAVLLDLRTIEPSDDAALGQALVRALAPDGGAPKAR